MAGCSIAWTALSPRSCWRHIRLFAGRRWMASAVVLWFGDDMSAVPLRNNKAAASAVRTVTVLGATGSIGDSTMDLLRASPRALSGRSADRDIPTSRDWRSLRRSSGRGLPPLPIRLASRAEGCAGRGAHRMRGRGKRHHRGCCAPGGLGHGGGKRRGRAKPALGRGRSWRHRSRLPTRSAWFAPATSSCSGRLRQVPASCRRNSEHNALFQALSRAIARNSSASSSPRPVVHFAHGAVTTSSRRRWRRR